MGERRPNVNAVVHGQCQSCSLYSDERHFQLSSFFSVMGYLVRYLGKWMLIEPKPYEAERMTTDIAWLQIRHGVDPATAYRMWFEKQRKLSRLLQQ